MRLGTYNKLSKQVPYYSDETSTIVIGKPQSGKTTLLCNSALDDIYSGKNVAFVDANGTGFETILSHIPERRHEDVIIYDASDTTNYFGLNLLNKVPSKDQGVLISTLLAGFKSIWGMSDASTANINQYVRATLDTLIKSEGKTLLHMLPLLLEGGNRDFILNNTNSNLHNWFWGVFDAKDKKQKYGETSSTQNKLWELMFEPLIRNTVIQKHNHLTFKNKIVLVKLPVASIGVENAKFLGTLVLTQLFMDARSGNVSVYLDDCHILGSSLLDRMITMFPKYEVSLTMSLTYLDQFEKKFIPSLIGGMGTLVSLRTSVKDTQFLEQEYELTHEHEHLHQIPRHVAYVRGPERTIQLEMEELRYSATPKTRRKIVARCISQYTMSAEQADQKFNNFCRVNARLQL